uniref:Rcs stress response system protein RcsF n=1 Tax=Microbulbifer agarilyticus TaxID=260552 RepID=UPI00025582EC
MKIFSVILVFVLCGCARLSVVVDYGPYATSMLKSKNVKEYSQEEIGQHEAVFLGAVEASHCQESADEGRLSRVSLEKILKSRALDQGANGIVIEQCQIFAERLCYKYMECRGLAYKVHEDRRMP